MDIWDLRINDLEITLKCTEDIYLQYRNTASATGAENIKSSADPYSIKNALIYQRMYTLKSGMVKPMDYRRQMMTCVQYTDVLSGLNHDVRISMQHKFVHGLLIFITPNAKAG